MAWQTNDVKDLDFSTESNFSSQWGTEVTEENESKMFTVLPEGEYDFFLKEVDEVLGKNPSSKYYGKPMIKLRFLVESRSYWLYIMEATDWRIRNIAEALKLPKASGESILEHAEGKSGKLILKVRKNKDGEEENYVYKLI